MPKTLLPHYFDRPINGIRLKDPTKPRDGETIGGGWVVIRRGDGTKRVRPNRWPFEYATQEEAAEQATKLATENLGCVFEIFQRVQAFEQSP